MNRLEELRDLDSVRLGSFEGLSLDAVDELLVQSVPADPAIVGIRVPKKGFKVVAPVAIYLVALYLLLHMRGLRLKWTLASELTEEVANFPWMGTSRDAATRLVFLISLFAPAATGIYIANEYRITGNVVPVLVVGGMMLGILSFVEFARLERQRDRFAVMILADFCRAISASPSANISVRASPITSHFKRRRLRHE